MITIQITAGEAFDRLSILRIKGERIEDDVARNVAKAQAEALEALLEIELWTAPSELMTELRLANEALWDLERRIREGLGTHGQPAIIGDMAKQVCQWNDRRFRMKCRINDAIGAKPGEREIKELPSYE